MMRLFQLFLRYFRYSAAAVLIATGAIKLASVAMGTASYRPDPIFQILNETQLAISVALIEITCAVVCLLPRVSRRTQMRLLFWLTCAFITYRALALDRGSGCRCFAGLMDNWNIASKYSGSLALALLVYLTAGSLAGLWLMRHFERYQAPRVSTQVE